MTCHGACLNAAEAGSQAEAAAEAWRCTTPLRGSAARRRRRGEGCCSRPWARARASLLALCVGPGAGASGAPSQARVELFKLNPELRANNELPKEMMRVVRTEADSGRALGLSERPRRSTALATRGAGGARRWRGRHLHLRSASLHGSLLSSQKLDGHCGFNQNELSSCGMQEEQDIDQGLVLV